MVSPCGINEPKLTSATLSSSRLSPCSSQNQLLEIGWNKSEATQADVEKTLNCCGFSSVNPNGTCAAVGLWFCFVFQPQFGVLFSHASSSSSSCQSCFNKQPLSSCTSCSHIIEQYAGDVLRFVGGIGLFFSFTEVSVCCWRVCTVTHRFLHPNCVRST